MRAPLAEPGVGGLVVSPRVPVDVDDVPCPALAQEEVEGLLEALGLAAGAAVERIVRAVGSPADLGDPEVDLAVAALLDRVAEQIHLRAHLLQLRRVRMRRDPVEVLLRALDVVELLEEIPGGDPGLASAERRAEHAAEHDIDVPGGILHATAGGG